MAASPTQDPAAGGSSEGDWLEVGDLDEVTPGEGLRVPGAPHPISVFRTEDGADIFALDDTCTHEEASFSEEGYVEGDVVVCGWHGATFCLRDGAPVGYPAEKAIGSYPVELREGRIFVQCAKAAPDTSA